VEVDVLRERTAVVVGELKSQHDLSLGMDLRADDRHPV
jgi:hypothetical protein